MVPATIAALALLWAEPGDEWADRAARLGSSRFEDREKAADELREAGRPALPALLKAGSSGDLEVRTRARALVDEIEAAAILRPSTVRLDFRDRPLDEVVDEIGRRSGVRIAPALSQLRAARRRCPPALTWIEEWNRQGAKGIRRGKRGEMVCLMIPRKFLGELGALAVQCFQPRNSNSFATPGSVIIHPDKPTATAPTLPVDLPCPSRPPRLVEPTAVPPRDGRSCWF